ncbi:hypothetical protein OOK31_28410 [Streptomyces sp. NBC_00249]|uniref:hypothetical protein n=1 Tax=Streptomyces sp. NBC_00249 TaxID=2975690 RepID=UPI00225C0C82|nr:hypothetical protein [Streptomyces sp. NBC_00249]MCX5197772.1 hypothetical protein [Streptomyces sp. NBC_00249]
MDAMSTAPVGPREVWAWMRARERVHPWQFALVLCALLAPLPPLLEFSRFVEGAAYPLVVALTVALVALPLLLHRRRAAFVCAARVCGAVLLPWVFTGALIGMYTFLPSVPLLWLASFADPRRRLVVGRLAFAAGALLSAAIVVVPGFWWRR